MLDPDEAVLNEIIDVKLGLNLEADKEELFWEQRAHANWLQHGDRNTLFFHRHASYRKKKKFVLGLFDEYGRWISDNDVLLRMSSAYFQELFCTSTPSEANYILNLVRPRVTGEHNQNLLAHFQPDEIHAAVFGMPPMKASGMDGYHALFFQKYWHVVGADITRFCLSILEETSDIGQINTTQFVLIPKVLQARNYSRCDFLSSELCVCPSYIWRSLWSARSLIEKGYGWRVGSGDRINIWDAPWIPGSGDGRVRCSSINIHYSFVSDLIEDVDMIWKSDVLDTLFDEEQASRIRSIPLSSDKLSDEIIWRFDGTDNYSVKSGYHLIRAKQARSFSTDFSTFFTTMWAANVPAKVKVTMWRIAKNFLPTFQNLQSHRLLVSNVCAIYADPWMKWIASYFVSLSGRDQRVLLVLYWAVWFARNKMVHEGKLNSVDDVAAFIVAFLQEQDILNQVEEAPEATTASTEFDRRKLLQTHVR
ncbi:hypothetical protein GQ457_03G025960 [Hibiscus cannabinus]